MRTDPLRKLAGLRAGVRVSLRIDGPQGPTDRIGLVLALDDDVLLVEDRAGTEHEISRSSIRLARLVPTVARGRNPRHAPPEMLLAMTKDPALGLPEAEETEGSPARWIARLSDVVDHLDDSAVVPLPSEPGTAITAACGESRGLVNGEWAAMRLVAYADLEPLAAWAARRNARNVVLTSPVPAAELRNLGLEQL